MKTTTRTVSKTDNLNETTKQKLTNKEGIKMYYRMSNTDPVTMEGTESNITMYKNKDGEIFAACNFDYPKMIYSKNGPQCHISATRLIGQEAVKAAKKFWGIEFIWCEKRRLCYKGICARETREEMWHYSNFRDMYGTKIWAFEGEEVAPIPLGDGYIVKAYKTINTEYAQEFKLEMIEATGLVVNDGEVYDDSAARDLIHENDDELHWDLANKCEEYWTAKGIEFYTDKECREVLY